MALKVEGIVHGGVHVEEAWADRADLKRCILRSRRRQGLTARLSKTRKPRIYNHSAVGFDHEGDSRICALIDLDVVETVFEGETHHLGALRLGGPVGVKPANRGSTTTVPSALTMRVKSATIPLAEMNA